MKLAACTVLYNPTLEIINNINSYLSSIDILYCIDNSEVQNEKLIETLKTNIKIKYISMNGNVGLAKALSYGCDNAINDGYEYILTMDQDTEFEKGSLEKLISFAKKHNNYSIVAPNIKMIFDIEDEIIKSETPLYPQKNNNPMWVITSGNILKLEDYLEVGGFDKKLFIGQIDQDYCCNLYKNKKKIIRIGDAFIYQDAGNTKLKKLIWKKVKVPQYSPIRYYYIFRNEFYLRKKWKGFYSGFKTSLFKYYIVILFYEKDKIKKFLTTIKALIEAKRIN